MDIAAEFDKSSRRFGILTVTLNERLVIENETVYVDVTRQEASVFTQLAQAAKDHEGVLSAIGLTVYFEPGTDTYITSDRGEFVAILSTKQFEDVLDYITFRLQLDAQV